MKVIRAEEMGKCFGELIDTTCPMVRRAHEAAQELQAEGRHVLLIGKTGHVEIRGIVEDLDSYDVIGDAHQVRCYASRQLGVVCQTTMPPDVVNNVCTHIQLHNPLADIRMINTVCRPTRPRQQSVLELVNHVDAVVVVGGRNSSNTRRLVQLCHKHLTPAMHVEGAEELEPEWFDDVGTVGLTAATSALDETLDDVHQALEQIALNRQQEGNA